MILTYFKASWWYPFIIRAPVVLLAPSGQRVSSGSVLFPVWCQDRLVNHLSWSPCFQDQRNKKSLSCLFLLSGSQREAETPCSAAPCCVSYWPWSFTFPPAPQGCICAETGAPSKSEGWAGASVLVHISKWNIHVKDQIKSLRADSEISKVVAHDLLCQINYDSELCCYRFYYLTYHISSWFF